MLTATPRKQIDHKHIANWLEMAVSALPVECDGMTRIISALLHRASVAHAVVKGKLIDKGGKQSEGGREVLHHWIVLADGSIIDVRARMWFGASAPHGVFFPDQAAPFEYRGTPAVEPCKPSFAVLNIMADTDLTTLPSPPIHAF